MCIMDGRVNRHHIPNCLHSPSPLCILPYYRNSFSATPPLSDSHPFPGGVAVAFRVRYPSPPNHISSALRKPTVLAPQTPNTSPGTIDCSSFRKNNRHAGTDVCIEQQTSGLGIFAPTTGCGQRKTGLDAFSRYRNERPDRTGWRSRDGRGGRREEGAANAKGGE